MKKIIIKKLLFLALLFSPNIAFCMEIKKIQFDSSLDLFTEKPNKIMLPSNEVAHLERNEIYKQEKKKFEKTYNFFQVYKNKRSFNPEDYEHEDLIDMYVWASHELANNNQKIEKNSSLLLKKNQKINKSITKEPKKKFTIVCLEDMIKKDSTENK
jgi:hypothetical protein